MQCASQVWNIKMANQDQLYLNIASQGPELQSFEDLSRVKLHQTRNVNYSVVYYSWPNISFRGCCVCASSIQ